ncbi:MAG: GGDEF domain-containing protein [Burkholderiales bacterium]|nr:GGDEF domain-containing protein [Burkholderiales bacterium]
MSDLPTPRRDFAALMTPRVRRLLGAGGLSLLLAGIAGLLAWGLTGLLASRGGAGAPEAALAAALAAAVVSLPVWGLALGFSGDDAAAAVLPEPVADNANAANPRSQFLAIAEREWARARRYGGEPALLLVEIDRFARLCESRGIQAADQLLRQVEREAGSTLRGADALARFGHSRIAVWLAQADPIGALDAADRIRERAEALETLWQGRPLRITTSVGVASLRPTHLSLAALVSDAEAAVQAAQHAGGNCVRAAPIDAERRRIGPSVGDNQAAS